ncbi:hypothetical protein BC829DRAFT_431861 [Chytridium lagenaria]|nr:hypothetical protein BC829DRAFT_431861 [Chytridium lagenaria]
MSSWLNSLAGSDGMSWVVKAVSEVESRIDRALDIQAPPGASPKQRDRRMGSWTMGLLEVGRRWIWHRQDVSVCHCSTIYSWIIDSAGRESLTHDDPNYTTDSTSSVVSQSLTSGLSSLRNLSTTLTSTLSAAPSLITPTVNIHKRHRFFSSMLNGLTGTVTASPPQPRKSLSNDAKRSPQVKPDLLSSILGTSEIPAVAAATEQPRMSLSERLNAAGKGKGSGTSGRRVSLVNVEENVKKPAENADVTATLDVDKAPLESEKLEEQKKAPLKSEKVAESKEAYDVAMVAETLLTVNKTDEKSKGAMLPSETHVETDFVGEDVKEETGRQEGTVAVEDKKNEEAPIYLMDNAALLVVEVVSDDLEEEAPTAVADINNAVDVEKELAADDTASDPEIGAKEFQIDESQHPTLANEPALSAGEDILKLEKESTLNSKVRVEDDSTRNVEHEEPSAERDSAPHEAPKAALNMPLSPSTSTAAPSIPEKSTPSPSPPGTTSDFADAQDRISLLEFDIKNMMKVIEEREKQLINSMTENATLNETANILRSQLEQLESVKAEENAKLETIVQEFTARLGKSEGQVKELVKVGAGSTQTTAYGDARLSSRERRCLMRQIADKDEKIKGLLLEGEKLSKNEFKTSGILKKLRAKETETDRELKELTRKLEASASDIADLKEKVARLADIEKKLNESLRAVNELNEKQAKSIVQLENQLAQANQDATQMNALVERSRVELQEARKIQAEAATAAQSNALEREIFDLRSTLTRSEDEASWREENMRKEVNSLQRRLQEAEGRYEELEVEFRSGDQSLIRQIELLQNQHAVARRDWEQIEFNLTTRIHETEAERVLAVERERQLNQRVNDLTTKNLALELQVTQERHESAKLSALLDQWMNQRRNLRTLRAKIEEERKIWEERRSVDDRTRLGSFDRNTRESKLGKSKLHPHRAHFRRGCHLLLTLRHLQKSFFRQATTLQQQLQMISKTRDELAEELLKSTTEAQEGAAVKKKLEEVEKEKGDINKRFMTALELLGEKTEQCEEMKTDMEDLKSSYRTQIDALLKRLIS